jgi:hypothetical protein
MGLWNWQLGIRNDSEELKFFSERKLYISPEFLIWVLHFSLKEKNIIAQGFALGKL